MCDDNGLPDDSCLKGFGPLLRNAALKSGRSLDLYDDIKPLMESVGFTNIQDKILKVPIGPWAKHPVYKDAGRAQLAHFKKGLEGWAMYLLTKVSLLCTNVSEGAAQLC